MSIDVTRAALDLARIEHGLASTPFGRANFGAWSFAEMRQREANLLAVLEIYGDDFSSHREPMPAQSWSERCAQPGQFFVNRLRQWLRDMSVLYSRSEPRRVFFRNGERLDDGDPIVSAIQRLYQQAEVNTVLGHVDLHLRLVGNVVLRPWFDVEADELVLHEMLSPNIRVVANDMNPRRPHATVFVSRVSEMDKDGYATKAHVAEVWTPAEYISLRGTAITAREPLATRRPPLVHFFDTIPDNRTGYFIEPLGMALAGLTAILANDFDAQMGFTLLMQGLGILQVFDGPKGGVKVGPSRVIEFSGDGDRRQGLEYAAPQFDYSAWVETVEYIVRSIREAYGIPSASLDVTDADVSGEAIKMAMGPLADIRRARAPLFRRPETDLLRAVLDECAGRADGIPAGIDPLDFDVAVEYDGVGMQSMTVADRIAWDTHLVNMGVLSRAEILMREKPDQFDTVEEAEAWLSPEPVSAPSPTAPAGAQEEAGSTPNGGDAEPAGGDEEE